MQSSNKKTILIIIGAICIMAGIITWLFKTSPTGSKIHTKAPEVAPHEIENSTITQEENGKKVWEVTITSAIYDKARDVTVAKGIKGTLYQEDGTTMTVTADEGEVNMKSKDIVLTKNPRGVTSDNGTLVADKVTWQHKDRLILAEGHVKITRDDTVATAKKATMQVDMKKVKLMEEAKVVRGATEQ